MWYIIASLLGMAAGAACVFIVLETKRKTLDEQKRRQITEAGRIKETLQAIQARERELEKSLTEFKSQAISYRELQGENTILKRDLRNIDVNLRKLHLDHEVQRKTQKTLDEQVTNLGSSYLKDHVKWVGSSLTPNNFANCKQRLQKAVESCRGIGFEVSTEQEEALLTDLKSDFEKAVRVAFEREEQARIKAQIREEQKLEKEVERELKQLERERAAIRVALEKALAEAKDEHSEEVEKLRARLAEAEEKSQRATSRAQMTKSGHVYVISNIGSFGEGVFKIGMTRRLEPTVRVKELGDASVPFPFDVHMMISSDDAPALENTLHRTLHRQQVNKANPRKEFFKTDIETIHQVAQKHHGSEVEYTADAEALEYRQSLNMSDEDEDFIESVYDKVDEGRERFGEDE